jgi:hypothetical protein
MPMILRFGLLMESWSSQLLSCLTKIYSVFSLTSILSSNSEILSSTCSSLLQWPSFFLFVCLIKGTFYLQDFCLILFSEVLHIFVQVFFYILCYHLYFIHLSFYSVLCFTLVFVEILSEFIYLFVCLLMFIIFGSLKFLEYILYILINHA